MARSLKQRVASGAKLLDGKVPGWHKKVKRTKLQMDSNAQCVLGQLGKGDAYAYAETLGLDLDAGDAQKYGFEGEGGNHEELWQAEIKTRLNPAEEAESPAAEKKTVKKKPASTKK